MKLSEYKIKGVSSIVRDRNLNLNILKGSENFNIVSDEPMEIGDLVLVKVLSESNGYC